MFTLHFLTVHVSKAYHGTLVLVPSVPKANRKQSMNEKIEDQPYKVQTLDLISLKLSSKNPQKCQRSRYYPLMKVGENH